MFNDPGSLTNQGYQAIPKFLLVPTWCCKNARNDCPRSVVHWEWIIDKLSMANEGTLKTLCIFTVIFPHVWIRRELRVQDMNMETLARTKLIVLSHIPPNQQGIDPTKKPKSPPATFFALPFPQIKESAVTVFLGEGTVLSRPSRNFDTQDCDILFCDIRCAWQQVAVKEAVRSVGISLRFTYSVMYLQQWGRDGISDRFRPKVASGTGVFDVLPTDGVWWLCLLLVGRVW